MLPLLTSDQMRALDEHAIKIIGIPGAVLMENAAQAVVHEIERQFEDCEGLLAAVLCGPGNNGGDGFAIARLLHLSGAEVDVYVLAESDKLKGDALNNYKLLEPLEIRVFHRDDLPESLADYEVIVDAIFGTGTPRKPDKEVAEAIDLINESDAIVIAVDVPSGVDASTGEVFSSAVKATATVTFQFAKCGLLLPPARDFAGDLIVAPISIPEAEKIISETPFALPSDEDVRDCFPLRKRDSHKGDYGKLLMIAGSRGMSGAAKLSAYAALKSGVGLVKVACPESVRSEIANYRPEIMTVGLAETSNGTLAEKAVDALASHLEWADCVAVGPGLGTDSETGKFLRKLFTIDKPFVIDADALNLIASEQLQDILPKNAILTPHVGEFERLSSQQHKDFYSRAESARKFVSKYKTHLILKGSPSISFSPSHNFAVINPTGNPGLATAGSGDVLTGMIASFVSQKKGMFESIWLAAYLHGRAADIAVETVGEISLTASDVIEYLPDAFASMLEEKSDAKENE